MDDAQDRTPVEALCDLFVYAPLGFALEAPKLLPELAAKGRHQVAAARTVGRFVVSQAAGGLGPLAGSVVGGVLRGLAGSRRTAEPAAPAPGASPADEGVLAAVADLDEVVVVPEVDVAALEPGAVAEAGALEAGDASADGQLGGRRPPAAKRRTSRPRTRRDSHASPRRPARAEPDPGDGLSGAPVSDADVEAPDLDASRPDTAAPPADATDAGPADAADAADVSDAGQADAAAGSADTSASPTTAETGEPVAPATSASLAIPEYDSLAASQVVPRLSGLSRQELSAVRAYEAGHRGRRTILGRADQLLARASGPES